MDEETAFTGNDNGTDKVTRTDNDSITKMMTAATTNRARHMISYLRRIFIIMNMVRIVKT